MTRQQNNQSGLVEASALAGGPVALSAVALKPSEVLDKAADLIEPEGAWTQGERARDARGLPTSTSAAVCWCAQGATYHAQSDIEHGGWFAREFLRRVVGQGIPKWNDAPERTQAEAVAALRKAAELARSEGQ